MQARMIFLAPASHDAGLTSVALGLLRSLQRDRVKVGFVKPVAQPAAQGLPAECTGLDISTHLARTLFQIDCPDSIAYQRAENLVRGGDLALLFDDIAMMTEPMRSQYDVIIIEGLAELADAPIAQQLNVELARNLGAEILPVFNGRNQTAASLANMAALTHQHYGLNGSGSFCGLIINKTGPELSKEDLTQALTSAGLPVPAILGIIPHLAQLDTHRLSTIITRLGLTMAEDSAIDKVRVRKILVAAGSVEQTLAALRPDTLVVASGERSDIALAAALSHQHGTPVAGLLLTAGTRLSSSVAALVNGPEAAAIPVLYSDDDNFVTASRLSALTKQFCHDDPDHMLPLIDLLAEHVQAAPLHGAAGAGGEDRLSPSRFRNLLIQSARRANKRIVLPEGEEPRTIQAAVLCHAKGIARCVLLGRPDVIREFAAARNIVLPAELEIIDPETISGNYVDAMVEMRRAKGLTPEQAQSQLQDSVVLGTMMLALDEVDGLVSGAVHTTASTVRPALQLIKTEPGQSIVSSVFFMLMPDQVLIYGDCAINPNPTADQLADIAIQSADTAKAFGFNPRVAMISYSTGASGSGGDVDKVREATGLVGCRRPDILVDGPIQYDAASVESVGRSKAPDSQIAGRANVFVFPDLNTGNTTYKAVQRSADVVSVGPMLQGLRKPVNDLSRGALVDDIVFTIALTAIQAVKGG